MNYGEKYLKAAAHAMVENLDGSEQLMHLMHLAQLVKALKPTEVSWLVDFAKKLRRDHDTEDTALSPLTDPQHVIDSMTRMTLPLTDTDAVVLMVHAVCVMEGLKVEGTHDSSSKVECSCYWLPLSSSEGGVYPTQRYTTPQGGTVILEPTTEDRGLKDRLRCHATSEAPPHPTTTPGTTHTHTCVSSSVLSLDTCNWVRSRFFWNEEVNITCNMTGDVARLRRVLVDHFLGKLPPLDDTIAQTRVDRLSSLSTHILHQLLAYLPGAEVAHTARTCKAIHATAQDSAMWTVLLDRDDAAWRQCSAWMGPQARAAQESKPLHERYGAWARMYQRGWHGRRGEDVPRGIYDPRGKTQYWPDMDKDDGSYDYFRHGVEIPKPWRAHHVYRYNEREGDVSDWIDKPLVTVYVGPYGW